MSESTHHAPAPQPEQIYRIVDPSKITLMVIPGCSIRNSPTLLTKHSLLSHFILMANFFMVSLTIIKKVFIISSMTVLRSIVATHFGLMMNIALSPLLLN